MVNYMGLNQLLCAAVINSGFRETLLRDPARAIDTGYHDHNFSLTPEERDLVISIKAQRLEDFAAQVHSRLSGDGSGFGLNGNRHRLQAHALAGA